MRDKDSLDVRKRSIFSSSAESLESYDDSVSITTQEQLYDNIRLHKEIIQSVKLQPWSLSKKYKIVQKAKQYVARHEDTLQERFAQSGNTKDLYARFKIVLADKFKYLKREFFNFCALLIPWEIRIKEIESRFGSVVASYFIFLRWLFWVNIVIANIFILFVIVPEIMTADRTPVEEMRSNPELFERKVMLPEEIEQAPKFVTVWDFEGYLKYSPLFYGYYSKSNRGWKYKLPIAYFLAGVIVYIYSFAATLRKMAENSRHSKLGSKQEECVFSLKLFTGWDYMIGHSETAANRVASVVLGFKEALLEEAEKQKDKKNWKTIVLRIFANLNVIILLVISAYAVIKVVQRSEEQHNGDWWRRNETTIVMSLISFIFPMLFELVGLIEYYHPRMQLRLQLARIMILNLLNLYSLIWAQFSKIDGMLKRMAVILGDLSNRTMTTVATPLTSTFLPLTTTPESVQTSTEIFNTTSEILSTTTSTIKSITEILITKFMEVMTTTEATRATTLSSSTEIFTDSPEYLDTNNPDYYEVNITSFSDPTTTQQFNDSEIYYDDYGNWTLNLTPNISGDLFANATNILTNLTTILASTTASSFTTTEEPAYYYDELSSDNETVSIQSSMLQNKIEHDLPDFRLSLNKANETLQKELRTLCWETMFGQELVKLTVMDLLLTVMQILMFDFFRALFVRYMNGCWCWDLEKRFPKYGDFKIAENILHLVNNQGMVWMGMFFSPGLAIINLIKLILIMYLRSWAVLTCNVPHEVVFRASRSNNFYLTLLLTMLFLCVLPVSYAIVWIEPSHHCGPFSGKRRMYYLFTDSIEEMMPDFVNKFLNYFVSPAAIIPLLLLLILVIYYLVSLTGALREANQDLKMQLHKERTEERKKMMKLMEDKIMQANMANRLSNRWKRVLDISKSNSLMQSPIATTLTPEEAADRKKILLARAMKNILRKKYSHEDEGIPKITTELAEP